MNIVKAIKLAKKRKMGFVRKIVVITKKALIYIQQT